MNFRGVAAGPAAIVAFERPVHVLIGGTIRVEIPIEINPGQSGLVVDVDQVG